MESDRPDTIRAIVASLVGDGESGESLIDDNEPIQPLQSVQVDDYMDPNWEPEPIDAGPGRFPLSWVSYYGPRDRLIGSCIDFRTNKPSDVISTLVSIYDSKDLFVKELQVLLAQRLLAITDGNFEKEVKDLSLAHQHFTYDGIM